MVLALHMVYSFSYPVSFDSGLFLKNSRFDICLTNVTLECMLLIVSDWEIRNKVSLLFDISQYKQIKEEEQQ